MKTALADLEPISARMKKFESNPTPELAGMLANYFEAQNDMKQAYSYLKKAKNLPKIAQATLIIKSSMWCIPVFAQNNFLLTRSKEFSMN